jgi:hypothetical protein
MEEILFEAAYAAVASLIAEKTWTEFDLDRTDARQQTVDALRERGVMHFYTRVVVRQLSNLGFPATRLQRTFEKHLEERLRDQA